MRRLLYPLFGVAVLGGYGLLNLRGIDPFATGTERRVAPADVRRAPGRAAPLFWYGRGIRGGK